MVRWYLARYHGTPWDTGTARMFMAPNLVGHFAITEGAYTRGDPDALFKLLVATAMFQKRSDQQIMRVLRGIDEGDTRDLTDLARLRRRAAAGGCDALDSTTSLRELCDLTKDGGRGVCRYRPEATCHLRRHTELLKRYGHFGKVPSSIALAIKEAGARDLAVLRASVLNTAKSPEDTTARLKDALCRAWRVSEKISSMFLSLVAVPDLCPGVAPPWQEGLDWTQVVVVDSNVDLFLRAIGYPGPRTYEARRQFVRALARRVDLAELKPDLSPYNPRLVQQAFYLFMSTLNRREGPVDCYDGTPETCSRCPSELRGICPRRVT